jgi:hypothetical protein
MAVRKNNTTGVRTAHLTARASDTCRLAPARMRWAGLSQLTAEYGHIGAMPTPVLATQGCRRAAW